jgi:hypothetical protein
MLPLEPGGPGAYAPSSGILSPGTGAADWELDRSLISSSRDTQAEMRDAIARKKTAERAIRLVTAPKRNLALV